MYTLSAACIMPQNKQFSAQYAEAPRRPQTKFGALDAKDWDSTVLSLPLQSPKAPKVLNFLSVQQSALSVCVCVNGLGFSEAIHGLPRLFASSAFSWASSCVDP